MRMSWKFGFILFCLSYVYGDEELNDNTLWKYMKSWSPWSWDEVETANTNVKEKNNEYKINELENILQMYSNDYKEEFKNENAEAIPALQLIERLKSEISTEDKEKITTTENILKTLKNALLNNKIYQKVTFEGKSVLVFLGILNSEERTKNMDSIMGFLELVMSILSDILSKILSFIPGFGSQNNQKKMEQSKNNLNSKKSKTSEKESKSENSDENYDILNVLFPNSKENKNKLNSKDGVKNNQVNSADNESKKKENSAGDTEKKE